MKSTSLDLSNDRGLLELAVLLRTIGDAVAGRDEWLLVGATARDLLLHHAHGLPIMRRTEDVDIAIAIATWSRFDAVRQLIADPVVTSGPRHRCSVGGWAVDMIPFGPIADHDSIAWPPDGDPVLNVTSGVRPRNCTLAPINLTQRFPAAHPQPRTLNSSFFHAGPASQPFVWPELLALASLHPSEILRGITEIE